MNQIIPSDLGLDLYELTRELDRTKSGVFLGKNAAFYGSVMCSTDFYWDEDIRTAQIDLRTLSWNPKWFLKLKSEARKTVLMHELLHKVYLHLLRLGTRNPRIWNFACDIRINNDLKREGYSFEGIENCWMDLSYAAGTPEEDIYDSLIAMAVKPTIGAWGQPLIPLAPGADPEMEDDDLGDLVNKGPMTKDEQVRAVNDVVRAMHQAKLAGAPPDISGEVETILKQFLAPVVPWEALLYRFMQDLLDSAYNWQRPNRRFPDIYLPGRFEDEGKLVHLIIYEDVSGSISNGDVIRFNSEVKYIKQTFNPKKITLVQFDTKITNVKVFEENDPFEEIKLVGRGGTCLKCVRQHMIENKPTAAIIFSDLHVAPMEKLPFDIPVIWVCISNKSAQVPFGQLIHIR